MNGRGPDLPRGVQEQLRAAAAQQQKQQLIADALVSALTDPTEVTEHLTCALAADSLPEGGLTLRIGLLGGRQIRFLVTAETAAILHQLTAPPEAD